MIKVPAPASTLPAALPVVVLLALALQVRGASALAAPGVRQAAAGVVEFEASSQYSHVRVRRLGSVRTLTFVRDNGAEALETQMDLNQPEALRFEYLRQFFCSYLFRPAQQRVLIVGLGGGGMIRFLDRFDSKLRIDAVEIDPLVVRVADEFFGVRSGPTTQIHTADGLQFIAQAGNRYDVIYMDAFLKPSAATDGSGAPLALRTREFYKQMRSKLQPGGIVVFNLNPHPGLQADLAAIGEVFPQVYVFDLPASQGTVAIAATEPQRVEYADLLRRAKEMDESRRFGGLLNMAEMARRMRR
jgi:spermidine synthase